MSKHEQPRTEIVDILTVCQYVPELPQPLIPRDGVLHSIDALFQSDYKVVVVEGAGLGKTTLLTQFALEHLKQVVLLYLRPNSRWGIDREVLRFDLANQLEWILTKTELASMNEIDDAALRNRWFELHRHLRRQHRFLYVVVDGLGDLPPDQQTLVPALLDLLPFGWPQFRFLFSGDASHIAPHLPRGYNAKSVPLPHFTLDETVRYFASLEIDHPTIVDIYRTCRGNPVYLAGIRRLLQTGTPVERLLVTLPQHLPDLFTMEWRTINASDSTAHLVIALLAHDQRTYRINDIARVLQIDINVVQAALQRVSFLVTDATTGVITFVSDTVRRFAADRLAHYHRDIHARVIDDLLHHADQPDSLVALPRYFAEAERYDELLTYLSPEYLTQVLQRSQSLAPVQSSAALGVTTARRLQRDHDLLRFSMQQAILTDLATAEPWRSEITARLALKDVTSAYALAQRTVLQADRLQALAVIAKTEREKQHAIDPEIDDQIRYLAEQIDPSTLGDRAIDIAAELLATHPEVAIAFVERSAKTDTSPQALDFAFAQLALHAVLSQDDSTVRTDVYDAVQARISDPQVRRFTTETSWFLRDVPATEIVARVQAMDKPSDGVYLLRHWTRVNRRRPDAVQVLEYALDLVITTTPYALNARVLRQLAMPLPYVSDEQQLQTFISRVEGQQATISERGPTEDYVRLWLILAEAEQRIDGEAMRNRLIQLYFLINELDDLVTKTTCMAHLVAALPRIDPQATLEAEYGMHSETQTDLQDLLGNLLEVTADHYAATRPILAALTPTQPQLAVDLSHRLNVAPRRDAARRDIVIGMIRSDTSKLDIELVKNVLESIEDPQLRDQTLLFLFDYLATAPPIDQTNLSTMISLIATLDMVLDTHDRCRGYCLAYRHCIQYSEDHPLRRLGSTLLDRLEKVWPTVNIGWHKVDLGFTIVTELATVAPALAQEYLTQTERTRTDIALDTAPTADTYIAALRLALRAFSGLLQRQYDTEQDRTLLSSLIERVPSTGEQAVLWAELALDYWLYKRQDEARQLVARHVRPLLQTIAEADADYLYDVLVQVAPALYIGHRLTAFEQIHRLPLPLRDTAYRRVCTFLLHKVRPGDPRQTYHRTGYPVSYEELVDICEIITRMEIDASIYSLIEAIVDTVEDPGRRTNYSQQQRAELLRRLDEIAQTKLPNPNYIQHPGYRVAAQAQLERLRIQQRGKDPWDAHIQAARALPNLADRLLVLGIIAAVLPRREDQRRASLFEEVAAGIATIPIPDDRVSRYEQLAINAYDCHPALSKKYFRRAMEAVSEHAGPEKLSKQRRVIDHAFRFDKELGASLASMADTDPARAIARQELQIQQIKESITSRTPQPWNEKVDGETYAHSAWQLLAALNGERINHVPVERTCHLLEIAARLSFENAYPIYAYVLQNAVKRHAETREAATIIRRMFEATLLGAELAGQVAMHSGAQQRRFTTVSRIPSDTKLVIGAGDRDHALQYLREWIEREVGSYLKISDAYFGPTDLELLKMIGAIKPDCRVSVLTSQHHHNSQGISQADSAYRDAWRKLSDMPPPETDIVIVGRASNQKSPIHDRWWITDHAALVVGTSFNTLGRTQDSVVRPMTDEEKNETEATLDRYLLHRRRDYNGDRLEYLTVSL
jgi:hypothetical protein